MAINIARYIVTYCTERQKPVSNFKLQNMLYLVWVEFYRQTGKMLFEDPFYAWQIGPTIPDVYYEFCPYAGNPITKTYPITGDEILERCIEKYIDVPIKELFDETHRPEGPLDRVYQNGKGIRKEIPFRLILDTIKEEGNKRCSAEKYQRS